MNFTSLKAEVREWDREQKQELQAQLFHYVITHLPTAAVTGAVCLPPHTDFKSLISFMHLSLLHIQLQPNSPATYRPVCQDMQATERSCISSTGSLHLAHKCYICHIKIKPSSTVAQRKGCTVHNGHNLQGTLEDTKEADEAEQKMAPGICCQDSSL